MGYSKAPEQPQSSARPICHSQTMTNMGREPATICIAAYRRSLRYALRHRRQLTGDNLTLLAGLHRDFYSRGISSIDTSAGVHQGRPYGGLAITWRKTLGPICKVLLMDDPRLMTIEINVNGAILSFLNVYLPYDNGNNINEYQAYLRKIESELSKQHCSCAIGDFNANFTSSSHRFGRELVSYYHSENLVISDKKFAPPDTFTYISEAHSKVDWLDHAHPELSGCITTLQVRNTP